MFNEYEIGIIAYLNDRDSKTAKDATTKISTTSQETFSKALNSAIETYHSCSIRSQSDFLTNLLLDIVRKQNEISTYREMIKWYNTTRNARFYTFWDYEYPSGLRIIKNPPIILFVRGNNASLTSPIAIAGTREPSPSGEQSAYDFAKAFAKSGRTVVSGLARGIDTMAHKGALSASGRTIAILGGSVDEIYPKENILLAQEIMKKGAIISETSPKGRVHQGRFIERNRIISAVSDGVVIAEASPKGGTIHQLKFAISQGKPSFIIVPEGFGSRKADEGFKVCTELGAIPVNTPGEVLDCLKKEKQKSKQ